MKKNSKAPDVRRKELIEVAAKLFSQKGYENVSVRDILREVNGAPGMFYYYFKSKQEIYIAVIDSFLEEKIDARCKMLEDDSISFEKKHDIYAGLVQEGIQEYIDLFHPGAECSIVDDSYKLWSFLRLLDRISKSHAYFIMQGVEEGKVARDLGINKENVRAFALYSLYGAWGVIYNDKFLGNKSELTPKDAINVAHKIFYRRTS